MYQSIYFPLASAVTVGIGVVAGLVAGIVVYHLYQSTMNSKARNMAVREAEAIVKEARNQAETIVKKAELDGKAACDEAAREAEKKNEEARTEIRHQERRLEKREDVLEHKTDLVTKKEKSLLDMEKHVTEREATLRKQLTEVETTLAEQQRLLLSINGMSKEDAKNLLMQRIEDELKHETSQKIAAYQEMLTTESTRMARNILATAIHRCAVDHTVETVVSTIDIPSDAMKGRIIGREGRNIRSFEAATGVDVIVDDTPGVIVISEFEPVRREVARRSMEKLISDGRIHPGRIEEVVKATAKELDDELEQIGKTAVLDADVRGLHPKMMKLLGRLQFRTSYGQNMLQHSLEVAALAGTLAGELGLDVQLAKRCGLLHDIGKAVDHEVEGGHPEIGADLCKRYGECPEVINAAAAHHEGKVAPSNIYTVLIAAADAVSASRPGARRETLERYVKRLERLEEIANRYPGVEKSYAIQAGREIRVIVDSGRINDDEAAVAARSIAQQIEKELAYPGEVKVTLLRETRVVEYAR